MHPDPIMEPAKSEWNPEDSKVVALWKDYRRNIYKTDTLPPSQEHECSLAFYGGMIDCLVAMINIAATEVDLDVSAAMVETLRQDIIGACHHSNVRVEVTTKP